MLLVVVQVLADFLKDYATAIDLAPAASSILSNDKGFHRLLQNATNTMVVGSRENLLDILENTTSTYCLREIACVTAQVCVTMMALEFTAHLWDQACA